MFSIFSNCTLALTVRLVLDKVGTQNRISTSVVLFYCAILQIFMK
jgi:hypothetical protein